jgi:hypothetical protein
MKRYAIQQRYESFFLSVSLFSSIASMHISHYEKERRKSLQQKKIISHYDCARTFDAVFGFHLLAVSTRFTSVTVPAKFYKYFLFLLKTHLLTALFRFH